MGGSSSKSTVQKLTDIATKVANESVQRCIGAATQDQLIDIDNDGGTMILGNISQKQGISINMQCAMSSETQNKIQNDLASQISAAVNSSTGDFTSGKSKSISDVDIKNILSTSIDNDSLSEEVSTTLQNQKIKLHNGPDGTVLATGVSQEQGASLVVNAMMTSGQYSGALNKIADTIDVTAKSESKGIFSSLFDMLGSMFNSWTMMIAGIAIAVIILGFLLLKMLGGGLGGGASNMGASNVLAAAVPMAAAKLVQKGGAWSAQNPFWKIA